YIFTNIFLGPLGHRHSSDQEDSDDQYEQTPDFHMVSPTFSLTEHRFTTQDFDLLLPRLVYSDFGQRHLLRQHGYDPASRFVIREQWSNQNEQRRLIAQVASAKIALLLEIAGRSMPLYRNPIIQGLEWQVRIGRSLDLDDNQSAIISYGQ